MSVPPDPIPRGKPSNARGWSYDPAMDLAIQALVGLFLVFVAVVLAAIGSTGVFLAAVGAGLCLVALFILGLWSLLRRRSKGEGSEKRPRIASMEASSVEHPRVLRQGA